MGYYKDLRELVAALDERGLLYRIKRQINKDTELMSLVRWQFRGLPEAERALRGEHYKTGEERATRRAKTKESRSF